MIRCSLRTLGRGCADACNDRFRTGSLRASQHPATSINTVHTGDGSERYQYKRRCCDAGRGIGFICREPKELQMASYCFRFCGAMHIDSELY